PRACLRSARNYRERKAHGEGNNFPGQVKVWASRGRLPHAVDSTACFVEIALRDDSRDHGLSLNQLRLLYASAFVRWALQSDFFLFVNGLVDPAQKGSFAVSVAAIAQRLHLPHWFVELRHAGTHEHLPSIQSLRAGTRLALQWLFEHYWSAPVPVSRSILEEEAQEYQAKEQLREAIRAYKGLRKAALKGKIKAKRQTPKPGQLVSKRAIRGIVNLAKHNAAASDFLSAILVELGFLVPTGKKCGTTGAFLHFTICLLSGCELKQAYDGNTFEKCGCRKRVRTNDLVLPNELRDLWAPLLCSLALARPDFATSLASTIIDKLSAWNSCAWFCCPNLLPLFPHPAFLYCGLPAVVRSSKTEE
ncbi:MAG: Las1-like-domain-containing protein, partial [Olpidium bornovanus]